MRVQWDVQRQRRGLWPVPVAVAVSAVTYINKLPQPRAGSSLLIIHCHIQPAEKCRSAATSVTDPVIARLSPGPLTGTLTLEQGY